MFFVCSPEDFRLWRNIFGKVTKKASFLPSVVLKNKITAVFMTRYYLDACIWLDFLEDRNEPGFPKSDIAEAFFKKVIDNNDEIIFSDAVKEEIIKYVRDEYVVAELLKTVASVIVIADSTMKEWNRAKEVSSRRNIPCFDSLHALLARKYNAVMITRDRHFRKLNDFVQVKSPEEFI